MGDPNDDPTETTKELASQMAYHVVNTLVTYAHGRPGHGVIGDKDYDYGFYPYGKIPSWSTKAFKNMPTPWLATTLAEMYNFLRKDPQEWDQMRKKRSYPMTSLWPWGVVRRHMCFQQKFRAHKSFLFKEYEAGGGEYHGVTATSTINPEDGDLSTVTEDEDNEFSDTEFV